MCLAIPGQILEVVDETNRLARVDVAGVQRTINIGLLDAEAAPVRPGDWVLIHVGFAMSQIDEEEAHGHAPPARGDGRRVRAGARGAEGERDRVSGDGDLTVDAAAESAYRCDPDTDASPAATRRWRWSCAGSTRRAGSRCARTRTGARQHGRDRRSSSRWRDGDVLLVHAGTAIQALEREVA